MTLHGRVGPVLAQPAGYVGLDPCASYPAPDTSRADAPSRMALALDTSQRADASSPDGAGADWPVVERQKGLWREYQVNGV